MLTSYSSIVDSLALELGQKVVNSVNNVAGKLSR